MNQYVTGTVIKELREKNKLTQQALAEKLGVSDKTVSKWETAKGFPDISLIEPLAEALDISVSEIIAGERLESSPKTDDIISDLVDISINEQNRKKKIYNWIIAITVAILYLIVSLITKKWEYTWLIWMAYCFFRVATEYVFKK